MLSLNVPVSHKFPSGPLVMPPNSEKSGKKNSRILPVTGFAGSMAASSAPPNPNSRTHSSPSDPLVMLTPVPCDGSSTSLTAPAGVTRPTSSTSFSVNQTLLSGPSVMAAPLPPEGMGNKVTPPCGVSLPMKADSKLVNHRLPSLPVVSL